LLFEAAKALGATVKANSATAAAVPIFVNMDFFSLTREASLLPSSLNDMVSLFPIAIGFSQKIPVVSMLMDVHVRLNKGSSS
jgi:hypothetical protein